jgi:hypothetical protein
MSIPSFERPPREIATALQSEIEAAEASRLEPDELRSLLLAWRDGDDAAKAGLTNGLRYLVYRVGTNRRGELQSHWLADLLIGLGTAIERLQNNKATDVEKFVTDELHRAIRDYISDEGGHIRPPASTNCGRRKAGKSQYRKIRRVEPTSRARAAGPYDGEDDLGSDDWSDANVSLTPWREGCGTDLRLDMVQTPDEETVFDLIQQGYSTPRIAATAGLTTYAVSQIMETFRERAIRAGYAPPECLIESRAG